MRHSTIFKSRWMALLWSAGIIWSALQFAGTPDDSGNGSNAADNSVDQAVAAIESNVK